MVRNNNWEELSEREGYIPETDIQPDYYIDRPPDAIFIPNPKGEMKATQIFEGDPDLLILPKKHFGKTAYLLKNWNYITELLQRPMELLFFQTKK